VTIPIIVASTGNDNELICMKLAMQRIFLRNKDEYVRYELSADS